MKARNVSFALCILIFASLISLNQKMRNVFLHPEKFFRENEKENDFPVKAMEYYMKRRVNPVTGEIPPFALELARHELDKQKMQRGSAGNGITWTSIGPSNIGGRTRAIYIDENNPNNMWAGGVSGGLWKSTTAGENWLPISDTYENLAVSSIAKDKQNGNMYFGTGEGFYYIGSFSYGGGLRGNGIWKSTDGGQNFTQLSSTANNSKFYFVNDVAVDPNIADRVYAATNSGFFLSTDGGANWSQLMSGTVQDICVNPVSGTVYLGIRSVGIQRSYSGNVGTFTTISNSITTSSSNKERIALAMAKQDTNYVYAVFGNSSEDIYKVVKSTDAGSTWTEIGNNSDMGCSQSSYDLAIGVSTTNKNTVIVGCLELYRNTGTPGTWTSLWGLHVDQHTVVFHPTNGSIVYVGNDGGIWKSTNTGTSWTDKNSNYNVTQFYNGSLGANSDVVGGTQDNGTIKSSNMTPAFQAVPWYGDGMFTAISRLNPSAYFFERQYGSARRSSDKGGSTQRLFDSNIDADNNGSPDDGGEWGAPMEIDENTDDFYFASSSKLWHASGATNFSSTPVWKVIANRGNVSAIATAKDATNLKSIFFGTQSGSIYRLVNAPSASPGQEVSIRGNLPGGYYITSIAVDPSNAAHLLVTYGNYGGVHIYETTNGLSSPPTWIPRQSTLPDMPVHWAIISPTDPVKHFLVGTELGVFLSKDGGITWEEANYGMARAATYELDIRRSDNRVLASTHGRGMFLTTLDSASIYGTTGFGTEKFSQQLQLNVYPNPVKDKLNISYNLNSACDVSLKIYSVDGRKVSELSAVKKGRGLHSSGMDVSNLSAGVYILRFEAESDGKKFTDTKRLMVTH